MKTKICIITAVSFILIGAIIFVGAMSMLKWNFKGLNTTKYETKVHIIDDSFKNISIGTDTAHIVFVKSKIGRCEVECVEREKESHTVLVQDGTLVIKLNDTRKWYHHISFFSFGTPKITVHLPEDKYSSLTINSSTGDAEIPSEFTFDNIDIKASTGNVNCKATTVDDLKIKLSTGHINVDNITAGNINLTASTGDINIKLVDCSGKIETMVSTGKTDLTDVTCESLLSNGSTGDMTLTNVVAAKDFNITRSTGDIIFDKCDANEIFATTDTGNVRGNLLSTKVFICNTDTGRVSVPKTTEGGKCEITTDTGDIKIEIGK